MKICLLRLPILGGCSWAALFLSLPREQKLELSEWLSPNHGSEKAGNPELVLRLEGKLTPC